MFLPVPSMIETLAGGPATTALQFGGTAFGLMNTERNSVLSRRTSALVTSGMVMFFIPA